MLTGINGLPIITYLLIILILVKPLGWYMAYVYEGKLSQTIGGLFEHPFYKLCGINLHDSMSWKQYLSAMLLFNALGVVTIYTLLRLQANLPLNPQHLSNIPADLAWNTAVSFVTNTNWQAYPGETTMSYLSQMLLTTQNFFSAATGMSLLVAFIRGISGRYRKHLGNFWIDTWRGIFYILLPLAILLSLTLVSQGVIQTLKPNQTVNILQPFSHGAAKTLVKQQVIPMGPVASQVAIKQLGANGGGFFNTNSAHPFENPTPFSNLLEMIAIMLIPSAFCYTFGIMIRDTRQGWAILAAMMLIFAPFAVATVTFEQQGNPAFSLQEIDQSLNNDGTPGGNMEGKETRFGIVTSALWATATTATANGSVNAMLDSFTPLGGLVPLWLMHLGEMVFGGVGSGLYGMLIFILITVFVAGLMVGRTPEYLGKKIEPFEMKMASIIVLIMPLTVLLATGLATSIPAGITSTGNPGPHGFTEILYAFTSMSNNNGSAFAGLNANTPFYNVLGGLIMLVGRFWTAIPLLAIAGALVNKKTIPMSSGTLSTHTPLFILLLIGITLLLGALSFLPALALGPIAEQLTLWSRYGR